MLIPDTLQFSRYDQVLPWAASPAMRLFVASLLGGLVGLEREWRHKASGLRTNMLMCLACAFFTLCSIALSGDSNPKGQVASNIVQGVGFLGAGLIMHAKTRVVGLTSAATVFVVSAIGMACGDGLFVEALTATLIVLVSLQLIGLMETKLPWKQSVMLYEVRGENQAIMFPAILEVMDQFKLRMNILERDSLGAMERVSFMVTANRSKHDALLAELRKCDQTDQVLAFPDVEQD